MKEKTENLIKRLELIKDSDPFNKRILNDCYSHFKTLQDEIEQLQCQLKLETINEDN